MAPDSKVIYEQYIVLCIFDVTTVTTRPAVMYLWNCEISYQITNFTH